MNGRFGFREIGRRRPQVLHALVEERERLGQIDAFVLELRDDRFEAGQALLELHRFGRSGVPRTIAGTRPSYTTSSNGMPSMNDFADVSVEPARSRGTAYPRASVARGLNA